MGTLADRWFQQGIKKGLEQGINKDTRLRLRSLLWLAVISALGPGCAHRAYEVKIRELSAAAPPGAARRAAELPFDAEYPVDVYLYGNYPEGLSLDEKDNLVIAPGFEARYTFLAVVTTKLRVGLYALYAYGSDRVIRQSQELRVVAAAMGGNVVVGRPRDTTYETDLWVARQTPRRTQAWTYRGVRHKTIFGTHVVAVIVLDRERPAPKVDPPPN